MAVQGVGMVVVGVKGNRPDEGRNKGEPMKRFLISLAILTVLLNSVCFAGDFEETTVPKKVLPKYKTEVMLSAGQKLADIDDLVEFAQKTVPVEKSAHVMIWIEVISLRDAK